MSAPILAPSINTYQLDMQRILVDVAVHRDGLDTKFLRGANNTACYFASGPCWLVTDGLRFLGSSLPVGNEDLVEVGLPL